MQTGYPHVSPSPVAPGSFPVQPAARPPLRWSSLAQFVLSLLAVILLLGSGVMLVLLAFSQIGVAAGDMQGVLPLTLTAAAALASTALVAPSAVYALLDILGRRSIGAPRWIAHPSLLLLLLPVIVWVGNAVSANPALAWFALPPLHVLAIGIPVLWILYMGVRGLPLGSPQRRWGVFAAGLVLGPGLILIFEVGALLVVSVLAIVLISSNQEVLNQLTELLAQIQRGTLSPDELQRMLTPYLSRPGVVFSVLAFASVIVPLIEELFKPIGVWLLAGKGITPAQGFALGLLSGAGYAFFESLALTTGGEDWATLVTARMGTAVIHIFTAGLMGWSLALAWNKGSYLRLAAAYLLAAALHGIWNAVALLDSFAQLVDLSAPHPSFYPALVRVGSIGIPALIVLTLAALITLLASSRAVRRKLAPAGAAVPA